MGISAIERPSWAPGEVASAGARRPTQIIEAKLVRAHCLELQRQVDDLLASASWKLTAPLRLATNSSQEGLIWSDQLDSFVNARVDVLVVVPSSLTKKDEPQLGDIADPIDDPGRARERMPIGP